MKLSPRQRDALRIVERGDYYPTLVRESDGWHARWRALNAENDWVDEFVRTSTMTRLTEDAEDQKHETLHDAWLMALRSVTGRVVWDETECAAFAAELREWSGSAAEDVAARQAIEFRLCPPADATGAFSLACAEPCGRRALKALGAATRIWSPLCGMMRMPAGLAVSLTRSECEDFLRIGSRELSAAGYRVSGCALSAEVRAAAEVVPLDDSPAVDARARVELTVRVAGEPVTAEEVRFLLDQGSSLVYFRDRWIEVDRNVLREALRALERHEKHVSSPLAFVMGVGHVGCLELEEIRAHGWLRGLVNELRARADTQSLALSVPIAPNGFAGELRDYQRRGVAWLSFLSQHGFGALLADDMGLGKTIQVIAWVLMTQTSGEQAPVLIVAPLTLLANWRHELAKFAPTLETYVHQGDKRHLTLGFRRVTARVQVVLTSYNLLVRDYSLFSGRVWRALVLDEAQVVKNPDTRVARAVRALSPGVRIALTGTPIENSVADIWSLEEFLNPGFLGDRKTFDARFVRPIAHNGDSAARTRLRHALEPFVLRRLKTDPRIAAEIGEKREIREYCELLPEARRRYEAVLANFRACEHTAGDVFALITELKLICDGESKLTRLCELLDGIFTAGESALVFTQYAKVGAWLQERLEAHFARRIPFLHGGLALRRREEEIARFNRAGPRAFVLSLKAGGYGLNLTKATHVIHFDRWWNPAVENQATDRAHRIGQSKTVFVHLFVTTGTLEEHVDEILTSKARTAGAVITEAEWLEAAKLDEPA